MVLCKVFSVCNIILQNGNTPLHLAFQGQLLIDYTELLQLLKSKGADLNMPNKVSCILSIIGYTCTDGSFCDRLVLGNTLRASSACINECLLLSHAPRGD